MQKPASAMRKAPTQARSRRTVQTIFDATARIVEEEGEEALSTNRIAERAGFSIGTLYQYFPSKNAVLAAMVRRRRDEALRQIGELLDDALATRRPLDDTVRDLIGLLVRSFGGAGKAEQAIVRLAWELDQQDDIQQAMREGSERISLALAQLIEAGGAAGARSPTPAMMFVATRAVMGAIRSASLERSPLLDDPAFTTELQRLAWGLLRA